LSLTLSESATSTHSADSAIETTPGLRKAELAEEERGA